MQGNSRQINITQYDLGLGDIICSLYAVNAYAKENNYPSIKFHVKQFKEWVEIFDIPNLEVIHVPDGSDMPDRISLTDTSEQYASKLKNNLSSKECYAEKIGSGILKPEIKSHLLTAPPIIEGKYIVFAPFATRNNRTWHISKWAELAKLYKEKGYTVIALDSNGQSERCKPIGVQYYWGQTPEWVVNVCKNSRLLISNDSGLAHLGGVIGCKTMVIMSQLDPDKFFGNTDNHCVMPEIHCIKCRFQPARGYAAECNHHCSALQTITPLDIYEKSLEHLSLTKNLQHQKSKLLVLAEIGTGTGFSRVTEALLTYLREKFQVLVIASHLRDLASVQHLPYQVVKAEYKPGDYFGIETIPGIMRQFQPDKVLAINDAPICEMLIKTVCQTIEHMGITTPDITCYVPIDGAIFQPAPYEYLLRKGKLVTYTQYGINELKSAFEKANISFNDFQEKLLVASHSVDSKKFHPIQKNTARRYVNALAMTGKYAGLDKVIPNDAFVVGWINRNQPRKNLSAAVYAFSLLSKTRRDCYLLIKANPADYGGNFIPLLEYYGLTDNTIIIETDSKEPEFLNSIYNSIDVFLSTSVAEGWGLTEHEAAACMKPLVLPDNTVRNELWGGCALLVKADIPIYNPAMCMSIGWMSNPVEIQKALEYYYDNADARISDGKKCYFRAHSFGNWNNAADIISRSMDKVGQQIIAA